MKWNEHERCFTDLVVQYLRGVSLVECNKRSSRIHCRSGGASFSGKSEVSQRYSTSKGSSQGQPRKVMVTNQQMVHLVMVDSDYIRLMY